MTVYFMRPVGMLGPVKVGNSGHPQGRLMAYNPISPFRLEIAATIPGDGALERQFHAYLADHWSHHEWFFPSPLVVETVERVRLGTFDTATLPKGRLLWQRQGGAWTPARRRYMSVLLRFRNAKAKGALPPHLASIGIYPLRDEMDALEAFFDERGAA